MAAETRGYYTPSALGVLVRRHRLARGLSQPELAVRAGVSKGYISQLETGFRGGATSRDVVLALAHALNQPAVPYLRAAGYLGTDERLDDDERLAFPEFVATEAGLTAFQKDALVALWRHFTALRGPD